MYIGHLRGHLELIHLPNCSTPTSQQGKPFGFPIEKGLVCVKLSKETVSGSPHAILFEYICEYILIYARWAFSPGFTQPLQYRIKFGGNMKVLRWYLWQSPSRVQGSGFQLFSPWAEFSPWETKFDHSWDQRKSVEKLTKVHTINWNPKLMVFQSDPMDFISWYNPSQAF